MPLPAAADDGAHGGGGDERGHEAGEVRRPRLALPRGVRDGCDGAEEAAELGLARGAEGPDAARCEELERADAAHAAPPLAGAKTRPSAPQRGRHGAGRERGVVVPRHLARRGGRRGHHHGQAAQAEQHERAVPARQVAQRVVRRRRGAGQVVQVADDRRRPRAGG
ncbi:LOW QUALITY PROTEIN: hypothetical protein U9M48_040822 [Paspalum notatum var. saurae]|uniref:Uncharacterized protein n=1 Tax=Paspalum notatum var. saurae TaxID=547442 RepID=A0AAQ3URX4_PASNO